MARKKAQQSPSDVAQVWLLSKKRASIEGIDLLPEENVYLRGNPLVVARGQAQAFYLRDAAKRVWILKKFLPGRNPDAQYVKAIQALVPPHTGFESGYQRKVLSRASVAASSLPAADFSAWLENTILMPRVEGSDWAYIADKVREGKIRLTPEQRLLLCRNLSEKVGILESNRLSHRDLSSTNIFIDTNTWDVHLIDWDSLYHPSLTIPPNTTYGTNGYIAPFVRVNGTEDARITWASGADRFSMAVLNIEFMTVEQNSAVTGDGGLLNQDEIYNLGGSGISKITGDLRRNFSDALGLFDRTLRAKNFDECPAPDEWRALGAGVTAPSLKDIYDPRQDFLTYIHELQKAPKSQRLAPPLPPDPNVRYVPVTADAGPPAPSLAGVESVDLDNLMLGVLPQTAHRAPRLAEIPNPAERVAPPTASAPAPAAVRLADIEDPFGGTS
jgi:serine/threonine protein kinase